MEIDLFTLIAQIINLLILLFLLRKFLYLPVLKAVEARQKAVAAELQASEEAKKNAQKTMKACEKQMQKLEVQKQDILHQAQIKADELSTELNNKAYDEYAENRQKWQQRLEAEQVSFEHTMQKSVATQFNLFAQKALRQIADADIADLAVEQFIRQLEKLSEAKQAEYTEAFCGKKYIEVQSSALLSDKVKTKLEKYLRGSWHLPSHLQFRFTVNPELIGGLCVVADEQLISWNLEEYLQEFNRNLHKEAAQFLNRGKND